MNLQDIDKQIRIIQRKAKKRLFLYQLKNKSGNKTKGLSENNKLILTKFLELYPLNNASAVICLYKVIESDEELLHLHRTSFRTDEPNRISIWIARNEKWGHLVFDEEIIRRLSQKTCTELQNKFIQSVKKNHILQATEQCLRSLQELLEKS